MGYVVRTKHDGFTAGGLRRLPKGGGKGGGSAPDYAAQMAARQQNAQSIVDKSFSGFNDDFYSGRKQAYLDYYSPEYQKQQKAAEEALASSIASRGLSASSIGAKEMGDFSSRASDAWTQILRGADDYVNSIKSNIAAQKASLVAGGTNAADSVLQQQAADAAALASATPNFSPLGQLFSNLSTPTAMAATSAYNGMAPSQTTGVQAATPYGKKSTYSV